MSNIFTTFAVEIKTSINHYKKKGNNYGKSKS